MKNRYCSEVISENGKYLENSLKGFVRGWRTNGGEHIHSFWSKRENSLGLRGSWKLLRGWECRACGQRGSSYWQFSARSIPRSYWMCWKQNSFLVFFNESKVTIITTNQILVSCPTQLICTWIFLCSITKLIEHSREIC